MCGNSKVSVNVPAVVEYKEYDVDVSEPGLEFLIVDTDEDTKVDIDYDYFDEETEQYEVYHEFALMQFALDNGRAIISEDGKTATLTITVPIVERGE